MKKIVLTMMAVLTMTTAFAGNDETMAAKDMAVYNMNVNINALARTLGMSSEQTNDMRSIHRTFTSDLQYAAGAKEDRQEKLFRKALIRNLACAKTILSNEQYHKYLTEINVTFINRGITTF